MKDSGCRFSSLRGNSMKLDGGSMFGNAPRALWERWICPDTRNMIPIGSTALLARTQNNCILFETGAGAYLSPDMKKRFQIEETHHVLLDSLGQKNLTHEDITHVILSHLHFDHAGGLLKPWEQGRDHYELLFPNARFITGRANFERSFSPHLRDRASFIPGLAELLEKTGRLLLVEDKSTLSLDGIEIEFIESCGHTPGMILSWIKSGNHAICFAGDAAPGPAWVNLPITMGYDRFPELLVDEKRRIFHRICNERAWIFYPHDINCAASKISFDESSKRFTPCDSVRDFNL